MATIRQSRPDSGLGFQVQVLFFLKLFPLRSAAARQDVYPNNTYTYTYIYIIIYIYIYICPCPLHGHDFQKSTFEEEAFGRDSATKHESQFCKWKTRARESGRAGRSGRAGTERCQDVRSPEGLSLPPLLVERQLAANVYRVVFNNDGFAIFTARVSGHTLKLGQLVGRRKWKL